MEDVNNQMSRKYSKISLKKPIKQNIDNYTKPKKMKYEKVIIIF